MAVGRREQGPARDARTGIASRGLLLPLVLLVSLLWRLPSLFDPPWVNDEGTYFAVAQAMAHGYRLYSGVWENKPPALYLLYSAVYHPFGASLIALRLVTAAAVLALVATVWRLAQHFVEPCWAAAASMLTGLLFGVPFLEGTTGNAEVFVALLSALAVEQAFPRQRFWLAGLLMAAATLFKAVAAFDALALGLWLVPGFALVKTEEPAGRRLALLSFAGSYLAALLGAAILAQAAGILRDMLDDAFLYDLGYVAHANGGNLPWLLIGKAILLVVLVHRARSRSFPVLWLFLAAFGALFGGRVFGHYLLQAVAPLVLVATLAAKRRLEPKRVLKALPLAFLVTGFAVGGVGWAAATSGHDSILVRRLQYYSNFIRFIRQESYNTYVSDLDDHVLRNEAVARAIKKLPPGKLLVWGNTPWIYVLSERLPATRYTSATRNPEVPGETSALRRALMMAEPAAIAVILPPLPSVTSGAMPSLHHRYRLAQVVDGVELYARLRVR